MILDRVSILCSPSDPVWSWKYTGNTKGITSWDFLVQLRRHDNCDWYPAFCSLMNTKRHSLHLLQLLGTSWMRSLESRFSTCVEECSPCRALLLHYTAFLQLWCHISQSKLRCFQIVPTVQQFNTATNMPSGGNSTRNRDPRVENTSLRTLQCIGLCFKVVSTGKLKIYTIYRSKNCAQNRSNTVIIVPGRHKPASSIANWPSTLL